MTMLHPAFRIDHDHYLGNPLAPVELIQYGDFQCEYCAKAYAVIKGLLDVFDGRVKFIYRHYPMPAVHPLALQAAVAAEAAALQGKFWYMHDMIFENQKYLARTSFSEFATAIDLDTQVFENCWQHRKLIQKVIDDFEGGVKSGVDSSPTFFINGARYDDFDDFDSLYSALENMTRYGYNNTERAGRSVR